MNPTSKIVLGTVQFGLNYGINNTSGQVSEIEAFNILSYAKKQGIETLDTAHTYGNSEDVIGKFIQKSGELFNLISKVPKLEEGKELNDYLKESLESLSAANLYAYLFHDFDSYKSNPSLLLELIRLKHEGKIRKIGFSLYYPHELEYLLEQNIEFDIVQVPYSVFDQRFDKYFTELKKLGKEVHVRSVFLQGLVFKNPETLEGRFLSIKDKLAKLGDIAQKSGLKISGLCLNFAVLNENIDKVVVGVDSLDNLEENVSDLSQIKITKKYYDKLKHLLVTDEQIILPINWK